MLHCLTQTDRVYVYDSEPLMQKIDSEMMNEILN